MVVLAVQSLIILPIFLGLGCLFFKKAKARRGIVIFNLIILGFLSLYLAANKVSLSLALDWNNIILLAEFFVLFYFIYIALKEKSFLIFILAAGQLIVLALFKLFSGFSGSASFLIDQLSLILCLIVSVAGSLICVYALKYMECHEEHLGLKITKQPRFFFWLLCFLGAMNGLVFSDNMLYFFFFWELTTLCCYQLIRHDATSEAKEAGLSALKINLLGGAVCLIAIILSFFYNQSISLTYLIYSSNPRLPLLFLAVVLFFVAAFTKAAQAPFGSWLLKAMIAPTPVSALLHSSTMVNVGTYLFFRLSPVFQGTILSEIAAVFGAFNFMAFALMAVREINAKKVLAYSTISCLGLMICCAGINTPLALAAGLLLLVFHAIAKGLLFCNIGIIEQKIGSRNIEDMQGLMERFPVIAKITVISMAIILLLPFGVLAAKWLSLQSAVSANLISAPIILFFIIIGSAASTLFWTKFMSEIVKCSSLMSENSKKENIDLRYLSALILLATVILLSVFIVPLSSFLSLKIDIYLNDLLPIFLISFFGLLAIYCLLAKLKSRRSEFNGVYSGGEKSEIELTGFYWQNILNEKKLNQWINIFGLIFIFVLILIAGA